MKKFLLFLLSVVMLVTAFSFVGCKQSDPDEVLIWWGTGSKYKAPFEEALSRYKAEHPDFKYNVQYQSDINYFTKYQANLLAGNQTVPDIVIMGHTNIQNLAAQNHLTDLSALGADSVKDQFLESTWNANLYRGKTYGLPLDANTTALMFNKDLFKGNGTLENPEIPYPTADWTYDDFLDACAKLKAKNIVPFEFPSLADASGFTTMTYTSWLARSGGQILSDDYSTSLIDSPESLATMQKIYDLKQNGYFNAGQWEEGSFYAGKIAMLEMGSWNLDQITGEGRNFGVVPVFKFSEEVGSLSTLGLYSLGISEKSQNKEQAYDFIRFLATDAAFSKAYTQNQKVFSPLKSALEDPYYSDGFMSVYKTALETAVSRPGSPAWVRVESYIQTAVEAVLVDGSKHKSPQQALEDCQKQITKELQSWQS